MRVWYFSKYNQHILMHPILKSVLAVILGALIGGAINRGIIQLGSYILPTGLDENSPTFLNDLGVFLKTAGLEYFVSPYLAHALGTMLGALVAYLIAALEHKKIAAFIVGGLFLVGGILASTMIPAPIWFPIIDILTAYIPMAWIASLIGSKIQKANGH